MSVFKFKPRKKSGDRNNKQRALTGILAIEQACLDRGESVDPQGPSEEDVIDLIADVLHACDKQEIRDPPRLLDSALNHWKDER